jgi:hypothetical protein
MAKRRPKKTPRLRTLVTVTGTGTLTDVTAKTETDMVIKIGRTATVIEMTSLVVLTTEDMPRLWNPLRTVKVAPMPTMWRVMTTLLAIVPTLVALIPRSRK